MKPVDFERLYAEHAQPLFGFLAYRTGNRAVAEDLLADTFERALGARRRFDPRRGSEKTWLYAIALNLARDERRRRSAEQRALERVGLPEPTGDGNLATAVEERQTVMSALTRLSTEERDAIALRFGADRSVPEIARILDLPLSTVEGRVYRALRKLRDELGES